jgi:hypothetical protein
MDRSIKWSGVSAPRGVRLDIGDGVAIGGGCKWDGNDSPNPFKLVEVERPGWAEDHEHKQA